MKIEKLRLRSARIVAVIALSSIFVEASAEDTAAVASESVQAGEIAIALADISMVAVGQQSFFKCQACHMVGENAQKRAGPPLNGIVGRAAGTVEAYRYSSGMQKVAADGLVWTVDRLDAFLMAPRKIVPGTTMGIPGIRNPDERKALIAYLASFKNAGSRVEGVGD